MIHHFSLRLRVVSFFTCLFLSQSVFAGDTLVVAPHFYHVDHSKKIIVINQNVSVLNAAWLSEHECLSLDSVYTSATEITAFEKGAEYIVSRSGRNYKLFITELPVISITTSHAIVDDPKVPAMFTLSENNGNISHTAIGIEIRGGFSQSFPKKSYGIECWTDTITEENNELSFLNMREHEDWNLQAMYNEPLRLNNAVSHELWREIHQPYYQASEPEAINGIRMEYVELFLNGAYRGVYALTERVDRAQLKLKKYASGAIKGELYKGSEWSNNVLFSGVTPYDNNSLIWGGFEYEYPGDQIEWDKLHNFIDFVVNANTTEARNQIGEKFDLENAIDYLIFLNVLRANDNTGKNIYIGKYKVGEPYFYIPWDLDGTFSNTYQGTYDGNTTTILSNGLYNKLWTVCSYREQLYSRWQTLRASVLTPEYIVAKFDAKREYLFSNGVYTREELVWPTFNYNGGNQVQTINNWLATRLNVLDTHFGQNCTPLNINEEEFTQNNVSLSAYPNPAQDQVVLKVHENMQHALCVIKDVLGTVWYQQPLDDIQTTVNSYAWPSGMYVVEIEKEGRKERLKVLLNR